MSVKIAAAGAAVLVCVAVVTSAQQVATIEWKKQLDVPRGQNMPEGVKADMLGIELGAPYAEVLSIVEKLQAEALRQSPVDEQTRVFELPVPGTKTQASYKVKLVADRPMKGNGPRGISEQLHIVFSAPSSGHQVLNVRRYIRYTDQEDQPRISELLDALKAKFKATPIRADNDSRLGQRHIFVFNKGVPAAKLTPGCSDVMFSEQTSFGNARLINANHVCDVSLWIDISYGISKDHASYIAFGFSDNERARQNLSADATFLESELNDRVRKVRDQTRGEPPKL